MHVPNVQPPDNPRSKRPKPRDEASPQPTDIDERLIALRRRTAAQPRPKEREKPERPTLSSPQVVISRPPEADPDDFSRRLNISSPTPRPAQSPSRQNQPSKLYNPERDPIPTMRRTAEPESMSDSPPHRNANAISRDRNPASRQLFDPRKDDPVRFAVLARPQAGHRPTPTPKSSGEYISASSTSSYAASQASSSFTLSSTTDGSSASSALFENGKPSDEAPGNVFAQQLKKLYRNITNLEAKINQETDNDDDGRESGRMIIKGKNTPEDEEIEKDRWLKQINDHKKLVDAIHNMLEISLAPSVPSSLRNIPTKYNIIGRLWLFGFQKLLESLRQASLTSPLALEHLQDFIYYAYTFYTGLLEEPPLKAFRSSWLEALGDLARYMMAVAAMVTGGAGSGSALTAANVSQATSGDSGDKLTVPVAVEDSKSSNDAVAARIDDSPSPSVGLAAARALEVEPEKERWRSIARGWYATGIADQPGTGKLHHHLGLLSREADGEVLRGIYHFVKSMTTLHPFPTAREKILPIWSSTAQARRQLPDARVPDLFVLLHGMLFTNIQLDDFQPTLSRFMERLHIEGAEEREWIMMAIINIGALLEYGKSTSVLKRVGCFGSRDSGIAMKVMARKEAARRDEDMEVDDDPVPQGAAHAPENDIDPSELPMPFKLALQLTFTMLSHVLRRPTRKASQFARSKLNPYLTILLTFLSNALKHKKTSELLERSIPWEDMVSFFATVPRNIMTSQGLSPLTSVLSDGERWKEPRLTSGCAPPLPEDWCMRGMEWVGRMVFERGYWKSGEDRKAEIEVLDDTEAGEMTDGQIEDDDDEDEKSNSGNMSKTRKRWVRIIRSAVGIAGVVDGLTWVEGTREWRVDGVLSEKVKLWREEERREREEHERRRMGTRWSDDSMDIDQDVDEELSEESDDFDENDSEEIKELKARRKYLRSLLQSAGKSSASSSRRVPRSSKSENTGRSLLPIQPGYTVLVIDTNILLSSLSMFASLVESIHWTVLVPLPVIMELDGLKSNTSQLGEAAENALTYISSHIRSHSMSLKVQTSKGNYLTTLNVRTEDVDFTSGNAERNMDDLILKAAIWHDEHWIDRSAMLKSDGVSSNITNPIKVVLLSLDRNLRLKARSRQLPAAGEKDLAAILSTGT